MTTRPVEAGLQPWPKIPILHPSGTPMNECLTPRIAPGDSLRDSAGPDVIEVPLLLPSWQVSALEVLAHRRGLTAAAMVRTLLAEFLSAGSAACQHAAD
jgi:hypothetical protein